MVTQTQHQFWISILSDIDVVGAANIDAGAASTITTSAGDLTLTADATNAKVVIKGDHESDVAIR